ncbi:probable BOI-related E3 ubiquitin-protein ligase 2 isoform X3 [Ananas comosus]|nr:probable BOI-related E3 ubiquitin-protein ligase 2 isoform X3 [Ananas comosus]
MFNGNNGNLQFPSFLEQEQFRYGSSASTQLQLFGNTEFPATCNVGPVNNVGHHNFSGLSQPNQIKREMDDTERQYKLQISLGNFGQDEADRIAMGFRNPNAVSTGLRLSYDDDEHNSSITSASGSMTSLPIMMSISDDLRAEIDRQNEEFDNYIKIQEEQMMKGMREMTQRHTVAFLNAIEKGVGRKLREKELEVENMSRKNKELVERIKLVSMEAQSWQCRAWYNESIINMLKSNLNQALAQGGAGDHAKEGCGESEVDNTAVSSYNPNVLIGGEDFPRQPRKLSQQLVCRSCKCQEVCMLLMPCRHLCLCEHCERLVELCPICKSRKSASLPIFMS